MVHAYRLYHNCGGAVNEAEIQSLRAQLEAVTTERDECRNKTIDDCKHEVLMLCKQRMMHYDGKCDPVEMEDAMAAMEALKTEPVKTDDEQTKKEN